MITRVRRSVALTVAAAGLVGVAAGSAQAHIEYFYTTLSGPAETPPNTSPGTGWSLATWDLDLGTLRVQTSFSGLQGNTTAAHIHGPTTNPGAGTAGVMTVLPSFTGFPLGVTAGSYDRTYDMTVAGSYSAGFITGSGGTVALAYNRFLNAMLDGKAYLNIHSSAFPGGEIRGFYAAVPAPSAAALLGLGGLIVGRRRR